MNMRFRAHDTFYIRKGWLSKGMKYVKQQPDVFISKKEKPMDILGIGSNMVKALRYWLQALNLTTEPTSGKREQTFTELGDIIFEKDRYLEELGTLYLLQYKLSTNATEATAWYFFFNEFFMSEFTKEDFIKSLQNYVHINGQEVKLRSLSDDFSCIINTYLSKSKSTTTANSSPENNIDCPFGELGLIDILRKSKSDSGKTEIIYRKATPYIEGLDPWVVLAVIIDQAGERNTISLNELLTARCNIGRIFNLNSITMLDILHRIEQTGEIKIIRTAGLDIIRINNKRTFYDCVEIYYKRMLGDI